MAANEAPYADAGPVQSVAMDEIVMLDGTFSADADVGPESLSYRWAIVSRPAGSAVETYGLTGASTASASFMPDVAGAYIARLEVTDGVASDADHTYVHAGGCENGPDVLASYERVNANGYGDPDNSFSWSATKFKGDLFFGTNRQFTCVEAATLQFFFPDEHFYPDGSPDPAVTCPDDELDLDLRAEIMRFSKVTQTWQRAFQSPNDLPVSGAIDKFAARDIGFRGMTVFEEPDGTEALYVAGVTSRMYLPDLPQPRILRSTDGINFEPLPLPDLEPLLPLDEDDILVGFRSILGFNGRLFVVATSGLRGDGWLLVSDDPTFGHFELVLLPRAATRAYQLVEFNDQLYVGIGSEDEGYEVWRTAAVGDPASFSFTPVVRNGAGRGDHIRSVVAMHPFKGRLYIGANGFHAFPVSAEMIRINPDDSFDIVAGRPRWYEGKYMRPISGFRDGMNNVFNVHFWRMQEHNGILYVGTNDASWRLRTIPWLDPFIRFGYGFDLFKTEDGVKWEVVTQNGFGEPFAFGVRTFISDETGLHLATANHVDGTVVWRGTPDLTCPATMPAGGSTVLQAEIVGDQPVLMWTAPPDTTEVTIFRADHVMIGDIEGAEHLELDVSLQQDFLPLATTAASVFVDYFAEPGRDYKYYVQARDQRQHRFEKSNMVAVPSDALPVSVTAIATALRSFGLDGKVEDVRHLQRHVQRAERYLRYGLDIGAAGFLRRLRTALLADVRSDALAVEDLVIAIDALLLRLALVRQGILPSQALIG